MAERPILFSAPMIRALLAGKKTQTRRIIKPQPPGVYSVIRWTRSGRIWYPHAPGSVSGLPGARCAYGEPGDRLWVREAWALLVDPGASETWDLQIPERRSTQQNTQLGHIPTPIYRANGERPDVLRAHGQPMRWRPGIHMPRWASRINLEITGVKVERLQDISEEDILAEGITVPLVAEMTGIPWGDIPDLFTAWRLVWTHINGPESWEANPYVWALTFKLIEPVAAGAEG